MSMYDDDDRRRVASRVPGRDVEVIDERPAPRRDRIRWGPVWAGFVVAMGSYILFQLILIATGAVDLADPGSGDAVISAVAALLAFFLGGLTAGLTALWRGAGDGVLHGLVMWATALVALIILSAAGSGLVLGTLNATDAFEDLTADDIDAQAADDAEEAAGWALLGVGAALLASVLGGAAGSKMWPRADDTVVSRRRVAGYDEESVDDDTRERDFDRERGIRRDRDGDRVVDADMERDRDADRPRHRV